MTLRLAPAGSLCGRLDVSAGEDPRALRVELVGEAGSVLELAVRRDGTFRSTQVPPGRWRLEVRDSTDDTVLARLEGVVVQPGNPVRDSRLDPLIVVSAAHVLRVRPGSNNGLVPPGTATYFRRPGKDGPWMRVDPDETGVAPAPGPGTWDVILTAPGHASRRVSGLSEDLEIALTRISPASSGREPRLTVEVVVTDGTPPPETILAASLLWLGPPTGPLGEEPDPSDPRHFPTRPTLLDGMDRAQIRPPEPGRYRVVLWLVAEGPGLMTFAPVPLPEPTDLLLEGPTTVRLHCPSGALAAARTSLIR